MIAVTTSNVARMDQIVIKKRKSAVFWPVEIYNKKYAINTVSIKSTIDIFSKINQTMYCREGH